MKKITLLFIFVSLSLFMAGTGSAVDRSGYDAVALLVDSAQILEAHVFAPKTWEKAQKAFSEAGQNVSMQKNQKNIDKAVAEAREYTENAIRATEVAKLSLQEYLEPRLKAQQAKAPMLAVDLFIKADGQFRKATEKVESGNVKDALKEAQKSVPLFSAAEMSAIQVDILGTADRLIEKAIVDEADKYALSTLDKAKTAREKANIILTKDRYNRKESLEETNRAEYEARHASNIALSVRSLNRNDQAWEKLMLIYEIQMNRIGKQINLQFLPFDNGPLAAADTLIAYISSMQKKNKQLSEQMKDMTGSMTGELQNVLSRFNETANDSDPMTILQAIDAQVENLISENRMLLEQVQASESKLAGIEKEYGAVTGQLAERLEREAKFRKAKQMLNPSEGEVLFNSSNDIVLRLSGLSFDVSKSDIKDSHIPLLEKVKEAIQMFPNSKIMVEGHTDAQGEPSRNMQLSEKRAMAVMQYLRQSLLLSADQISAVGYGAEKPVGSNQNESGRAKNRRIDIIIMR